MSFNFNRSNGILANTPPVVKNIILINAVIFLACNVFPSVFGIRLSSILAFYNIGTNEFRPYQIVTYMFTHEDFMHAFFNLFAVWMFGRIMEITWGSKKFFIYYMATGIGAILFNSLVSWGGVLYVRHAADALLANLDPNSLMVFIKHYFPHVDQNMIASFFEKWSQDPDNPSNIAFAKEIIAQLTEGPMPSPTIGASGAVFGILLAYGMTYPNTIMMLIFPPIPMKAKYFVMGYGLLELWSGISNSPTDNIAHFAHLGGMVFGFILIKMWKKKGIGSNPRMDF